MILTRKNLIHNFFTIAAGKVNLI